MEEFFAAFYLLDELVGIAEAACNGYLQRKVAGLDLECFYAFKAAYAALGNACYLLGRDSAQNVADNGFGDAAGNAEDDAGAGVLGKGIVRLGVRQVCKVYAGLFYHFRKLLRCEHEVDEPLAVLDELGTGSLGLLCRAGHYCNGIQLIVGVVLAEYRAEHLHRRAAGGNLGHEMRVHVLNMLDPAGAAGGEHGKLCAGLELVHKLGGLLHYSKVGSQRGIKNVVRAEHFQRRNYLAHNRLRGRHAELFADTDAHSRRDLNGDLLCRVVYCRPELGDLVFYDDSAGGAYSCALAAAYALCVGKLVVKAAGDIGLDAALCEVNCVDVLNLRAHSDALSAENAL